MITYFLISEIFDNIYLYLISWYTLINSMQLSMYNLFIYSIVWITKVNALSLNKTLIVE